MAAGAIPLNKLPADMLLLILYHYLPSLGAAIAAVILYAVISIAVTAVTVKTRAWYMMTVAFTAVLELTGELWVAIQLRAQEPEAGAVLPAGHSTQWLTAAAVAIT